MKTWDETYKEITDILQKEISNIALDFIGEPNTIETQAKIRMRMAGLGDIISALNPSDDLLNAISLTYDFNDNIVGVGLDHGIPLTFDNLEEYIDGIVDETEEEVITYIQEHYDKYDIQEKQEYMYQIITDKSYDIIIALLNQDYFVNDNDMDNIVDAIQRRLDFSEFYETIEDILHAAMTMEEKLEEVGMSYRDFL